MVSEKILLNSLKLTADMARNPHYDTWATAKSYCQNHTPDKKSSQAAERLIPATLEYMANKRDKHVSA